MSQISDQPQVWYWSGTELESGYLLTADRSKTLILTHDRLIQFPPYSQGATWGIDPHWQLKDSLG